MKSKATQIYGYVVCVVCIITFLITLSSLISAIIDKSDPMRSTFQAELNMSSFESYKVDAMKAISTDAAYIPADAELHTMYSAAIEDLLARRNHMISRNITVSSIILVISIILFFIHWKWMVRFGNQSDTSDG